MSTPASAGPPSRVALAAIPISEFAACRAGPSTVPATSGLERRGFIHRLPSPDDRRKVIVELTPEGRRIWRAAGDQQGAEEARILAALAPADRKRLEGYLRAMLLVIDRPELLRLPKQ
jgi:hypothetical protein